MMCACYAIQMSSSFSYRRWERSRTTGWVKGREGKRRANEQRAQSRAPGSASCRLLLRSDWSGLKRPVSSLCWGREGLREKDHRRGCLCQGGDQVAGLRVTISGLFHRLHSSGQANSKHICCRCSRRTSSGTSSPLGFVLAVFIFECLLLYWSSISFIFHQNLFSSASLASSRQFLFLSWTHFLHLLPPSSQSLFACVWDQHM